MICETAVPECHTQEYYACSLAVSCSAFTGSGETRWSGRATQIANDGIHLTVGRRFERGTILRIQAGVDEDGGPVLMLGRVVRVSDYSGGTWGLECQFSPPLNNSDLRELLRAADR